VDALNTLRAVLVGCSFVATLLLAFRGQWIPAAVMSAGIAAHAGLWVHLRAQRRRDAMTVPLGELSLDR
jgi:CHASE2 domain-containing sensor protein